jgi:amino acid transporter
MFLGLAMVLVALLWARDIRRGPNPDRRNFRGPWTMGLIGVAVFVFYLWLVTHDAVYA